MKLEIYIAIISLLPVISSNAQLAQNVKQDNQPSISGEFATWPEDIFQLEPLTKVNHSGSEFGGYPCKKDIFYCSSNRVLGSVLRRTKGSHQSIYNLFRANYNGQEIENSTVVSHLKNVHIGPVCATKDGRYLYVTADNFEIKNKTQKKRLGIYRLSLMDKIIATNVYPISHNSIDYSVAHPALSLDGKTLYFASNKPGGYGGIDLYKSPILPNGNFGEPVNLGPQINTSEDECFPWIGNSGELYFSSNGLKGFGEMDVFMAQLNNQNEYDIPINLGSSVNTQADEFAFITLPNSNNGFVSSNRDVGHDNIYRFTLDLDKMEGMRVKGVVKDKFTKEILHNVTVQLISEQGEIETETITDENGNYTIRLANRSNYQLVYAKDDYFADTVLLKSENANLWKPMLIDTVLEDNRELVMFFMVSDRDNQQPLSNVSVTLIDKLVGDTIGTYPANDKGEFKIALPAKRSGDQLGYEVLLKKNGFISGKQTYNGQTDRSKKINLNLTNDMKMSKIDSGKDLGELISLNPIYFDVRKHNIRPDAERELARIIEVMDLEPTLKIELGSHTDSRGTPEDNLKLSERRAKTTAEYIKAFISNPERVTWKGYGEKKLINKCKDGVECSEEQHAQNRRTEFRIVSY